MKLVLEIEGNETSLRTVFEVVEKVVLGVATPGSLSIKKAVIEYGQTQLVLGPSSAADYEPAPLRFRGSCDGIDG